MVHLKLGLFIAGEGPQSQRALDNLDALCVDGLAHCEEVEVVDVVREPGRVDQEQVYVTPMLIRHLPKPVRRVVGDLSDRQRLLASLDLLPSSRLLGR